jgi:ribonuclease HII
MAAKPDFSFERLAFETGARIVCGVDEAGRGPWAGPVVAAAVILDTERIPIGLNDSKKLSEARREALCIELKSSAEIGIGIADVSRIDRDNILAATFWAMQQAIAKLAKPPDFVLIDGNRAPRLACRTETIVSGDARSLSIAAASIVAKVTRDGIMKELDLAMPEYGFARHKGYGTAAHAEALRRFGPSEHHRKSFAPIAALLAR